MGFFGKGGDLAKWSQAHMGAIPSPVNVSTGALADALGGTADMLNQYVVNPVLAAQGALSGSKPYQFPTGAVQAAVPQPKGMMGRAGRAALAMAIPVPGAQEVKGAQLADEMAQTMRNLKWGETAQDRLIRAQRVLSTHGGAHPEALAVAHQAADELGMPRIDASKTLPQAPIETANLYAEPPRPPPIPTRDVLLSDPPTPTAAQMAAHSSVQDVPLASARSTQGARQWDRFNSGDHPAPLIAGYAGHPVAVGMNNGEYLLYDGHHRADLAAASGAASMPMHVIPAQSYAPSYAGRAPKTSAPEMSADDLMRELFGDQPQAASPAVSAPTGNQLSGMLARSQNGSLRGMIAPDGGLHFWDAADAIHSDGAASLGIPYHPDMRLGVSSSDGDPVIDYSPNIDPRTVPGLQKLLGDKNAFFDGDSSGIVSGPEFSDLLGPPGS